MQKRASKVTFDIKKPLKIAYSRIETNIAVAPYVSGRTLLSS